MENIENTSDFLFYTSNDGKTKINVIIDDKNETVWLTQQRIAELFNVDRTVITKHIKNIFDENELDKETVSANFAHTASDGKVYKTNFYNLDAIISVGYRVNSYEATQFRKWANSVLKQYLIKGFALDDDRLKQGKTLFGKDYFDELIEKIREIRASERRFYQKITDIYITSSDYDKKSPTTQTFFATVQNKLEFAITHHTAPELIKSRADSKKPYMGLTSYKNSGTKGKILKSDVTIAKNYLNQEEITELNRIVTMYLDYAENQAKRGKVMTMKDWASKLDAFLIFNDYDVLENAGSIKTETAKKHAEKEYEKFRIQQDKDYVSDFDVIVEEIKVKGEIPKEGEMIRINTQSLKSVSQLSDLNKKLKRALDYNPNKDKKQKPE